MPRPPASQQTEQRVDRLMNLLFDGMDAAEETVASLARQAKLGHETVRRLRRNPGARLRTGPSFFVVASIARARGLSLDRLAEGAMQERPTGLEDGSR